MKRGSFLKLIATLVVAPTLIGEKIIEPYRENQSNNVIDGSLRFYTKEASQYKLRDIIVSDMGDKAVILVINLASNPYVEARPIIMGRYRYKDLQKFQVFGQSFSEK